MYSPAHIVRFIEPLTADDLHRVRTRLFQMVGLLLFMGVGGSVLGFAALAGRLPTRAWGLLPLVILGPALAVGFAVQIARVVMDARRGYASVEQGPVTLRTVNNGIYLRLNGREFNPAGWRNRVYEEAGAPQDGDVCRIRCLPTSKLVLALEVRQRHSTVGSGSK